MRQPVKLLAAKLEAAILRSGLTKAAFAEEMGVAPSAVSKWVQGKNQLPAEVLHWLSGQTGESVASFLGIPEAKPPVALFDAEKVAIPRLLSVAAGNPVFNRDHKVRDKASKTVLLERRPIEQLVGPIGEQPIENVVFACDVKGDSMAPGIMDGDVLVVRRWWPPTERRAGEPIIEDEGVYVIADPRDQYESATVKRLVLKERERRLLVISDNKRHKAFTIDLTAEESMVRKWQQLVLGVPVKLIRDL